jgi:flavin-binding protein dodecin
MNDAHLFFLNRENEREFLSFKMERTNYQPNLVKEEKMSESVYKIIDLVGSSPNSWEEAAKNAVETAGKNLRDLRVAEIDKLDMKVEDGKVVAYRARVLISFKYQS